MLSNPQMASLFEHGTSLSPAAKGTLRAVLRDAKTPLSSLAPVIKEWTALDPTRAPSDSVAALAPLLVWSCTRDAHAKVAHLHVLTKWTMHFKHGFEPVDVLETTKLIQSLTSCLAHISDIPFSPSHMEAISNCVPHAIAAADMKFKAVTPSGAPNTYALDETKNALLLSLIELVHAPAIDKWSSEDLRCIVQTSAKYLWSNMANHLTAACAHEVLDLNIPAAAKLDLCYQLSSWAWNTHELSQKILPLLPADPYERALALPWGGKPNPVGKNQALIGVRINRVMAAQYVPELCEMMLLANETIGAWRSKTGVLGLLTHFAPKTQEPMALSLPSDLEFAP